MKKYFILLFVLSIGLILDFTTGKESTGSNINFTGSTDKSNHPGNLSTSSAPGKIDINFGRIPLYFIPNRGQVNKKANFYARASRYTLWLTKKGLIFDSFKKVEQGKQETDERQQMTAARKNHPDNLSQSHKFHRNVSRLIFLNACEHPEIIPVDNKKLKVNYFIGSDKSKWHCDIPTSGGVLYKNLYKNIDLKVYGIERQIEYDWIVKPGAKPGQIRFNYQNVKGTRLDKEGNLLIETEFGELIHKRPDSYQYDGNDRIKIEAKFKQLAENIYGFEIGEYDKRHELIIDPVVLAYSTFLGGNGFDWGFDIAVDTNGYVYLTGETTSTSFPILGQYQGDTGDSYYDAFVSRLDTLQSGEACLVYSTYLGGGDDDRGYSIAVGNCCNVYVTGRTKSTDFPTLNQYQGYQGDTDTFVAALDTSQSGVSSLIYSTYLGGTEWDMGTGISVDPANDCEVFVTGYTDSTNFPIRNQYQENQYGRDIFVTRLDTQQNGDESLIYSTYLGGSGLDGSYGIEVEKYNLSGIVYIGGTSSSPDFPTLNQYQGSQGDADVIVSKLDTKLSGQSGLLYSTYLGGEQRDYGHDIALDSDSRVYVTGRTNSIDFPTVNQYMGDTGDNDYDVFVSSLDTTQSGASSLVYSTYLGGADWDEGDSIAVDFSNGGNVYVTGYTKSTDFPIINQYQVNPGYVDIFVTRLDTDRSGISSLIYSTYLGGGASQFGSGIAWGPGDNIYVTGETSSSDFPTLNQYQGFQGIIDVIITKISAFQPALPTVTTNAVSNITAFTAESGGNISDDGGADIISRGVCWSTSQNPSTDDSHTTDGSGTGTFSSTMTGLTPDTVYYLKAYAVNAAGTAYGSEETFETESAFITVTHANGGEILVIGSEQNITWTHNEVEGNVKIEYSIDNGQNWIEIVSSTENDGSYLWTVPFTPSYLCLIRVSEVDGSPSDTSDSVFTIATSSIVIPASEREALIALYEDTRGFQWLSQTNWKKPDGSFNDPGTEYTWYGITVENNHVVEIDLSYNELEGTLPAEIGNFSQLTKLDLKEGNVPAYDPISGPIPATIGNLTQLYYLDFSGNDFDGNIPAEIGNLSNLVYLNLYDNSFTGSIPSSLGNLVNLQTLIISNSRLSGTLPGSLTNLVNLRILELNNNDIEGNIPSTIGNLIYLESLGLSGNALSGAIPAGLGNLVNLTQLYLGSNKLVGSIPTGLTNLTALTDISIRYNGLYTDNDALIAFLNQGDPDWQNYQTIAPEDVSATVLSGHSVQVSWTPILYTADEGGYRVYYSTSSGGPYTFAGITDDKTVSSMTVTGLTPDTPYYFVVRTRTLGNIYSYNENTVYSEFSDEVSAATYSSLTVISPNGGENWDVGSVQDITWSSEGNVGNVKIEYSLNGGNSWGVIVQSTENDGSYNWNIPAKPSVNCLVRVSEQDMDGGPSDISDAEFSIDSPLSGSITLRSPNGGESWIADSLQEIKWSSTGDINYVTIKYSRDNGTTWKTITQSTTNTGSYNWVVPETVSDMCLVRVTGNDSRLDPRPSDVSDTVFSILLPSVPFIKVTAPNGGEKLTVGSRYTITWESAGTRENVQIEYSVNDGEAWREISGTAANSGKYDWTVPDAPSENCLVRISETNGQALDVSDALFSILSLSPSDITITSPNGSESWTAGSVREITWSTTGGIEQVSIAFSKDYGTTWETIVQTTPNSGSFDWTIPAIASDECLVRVASTDTFSDPKPADSSDAVFAIVPPASPAIRVITPNGGEQLAVGSRFNITWEAINSREKVNIEYSVNGGQTWTMIAESMDNNGDYDWLVPAAPSEACLVRISEIDEQPLDISDAVFSIVEPLPGEITVTSPNGGESWTVGSLQEIQWDGSAGINNVTIEYSTDYGVTWKVIAQTTANDGSYDWLIPEILADECLVRISSNDSDQEPTPTNVSDDIFSIVPDRQEEFRVISPNGGESWEAGTTQPVTWSSSGDINIVMIEYSRDNGNTWDTIVSSTGNSGAYDWQVPEKVSEECLVRITANDGDVDPKPMDVSDSQFSIILPSSPMIRVITPNGGEQLFTGSKYEITWFSTNSREPVKIESSFDGGQTWRAITDSTENDGDYEWIVPDEPSESCLIRISETDGQPLDISDAVFSVVRQEPGDLTVLTPNGGENLESGSEYDITWSVTGLNNVLIEYSVNNGVTWLYIDKVPADNGSYTWTVPGTASEICLVRVRGADSDENPVDISDGIFTISNPSQASIEVFTPNGGEILSAGEEYYITWASTGINNVLIEFSTDNGDEWLFITDTVPAPGGRFIWIVPDIPSDSCLIRITGNDSPGDPADVSDALFSIITN